MRIETSEKHNRTLVVRGIRECADPLEIDINYTGDSNVHKAVALDGTVIPTIIDAVNCAAKTNLVGALRKFCQVIEVTGGVMKNPECDGTYVCAGDDEWVDLADAYIEACHVLKRKPMVTD